MKSEIEYAQAHFPRRWRIMGLRLEPFKLGHRLILQSKESPFVVAEKDMTVAHLIFALWVCSRSFSEAASGKISFRWMLWSAVASWRLNRREKLFHSRTEMFFSYMLDAYQSPKGVGPSESDSDAEVQLDTTTAPTLMILKGNLMARGFTEDQCFEMSIRKAIIENLAQQRKEGLVKWPEDLSRWPAVRNEPDIQPGSKDQEKSAS